MITQLIRKLSGARDLDWLTDWARTFMEETIRASADSGAADLRFFKKHSDALDHWSDYVSEYLREIASESTAQAQLIAIRRALLKEVEAESPARRLMRDDLSDADRSTLLAHFFPGKPELDALAEEYQLHVFALATFRCFRALGVWYGDTAREDWFDAYVEAQNETLRVLCDSIVKKAQGEHPVFEPIFLTVLRAIADRIKQRALAGQTWRHTPGMIERAHEEARSSAS